VIDLGLERLNGAAKKQQEKERGEKEMKEKKKKRVG
jgi:hypothetical protein